MLYDILWEYKYLLLKLYKVLLPVWVFTTSLTFHWISCSCDPVHRVVASILLETPVELGMPILIISRLD